MATKTLDFEKFWKFMRGYLVRQVSDLIQGQQTKNLGVMYSSDKL